MSDKLEAAIVAGIALVFTGMRLVGLGRVYLWDDDILTLGPHLDAPGSAIFREVTVPAAFGITGPALPTLLYRWQIMATGVVDPFALRLIPLGAGVLSLGLLWLLSRRLFPEAPAVRVLLLVMFTFLIPSVLYSRQIQPSIFYALGTLITLYAYVRLMEADPWRGTAALWAKQLGLLGIVGAAVHFFNYVSVAVYCMLVGHYVLGIYINGGGTGERVRKFAIALGVAGVATVPLAWLSFERITSGLSVSRPYFDPYYYIDSIIDPFWLTYDMLAYNFNFAFEPRLYAPLSANLLTLPFVLVCVMGLVAFVLKREEHAVGFVVSFVFLCLLSLLKFYPLGGVRHSLMLAPFAYLSFGYGLLWLGGLLRERLPLRAVAAGFGVYALLIFALWGRNVYGWREARLDPGRVMALAAENDVERVMGMAFTYDTLHVLAEGNALGPLDVRRTLEAADLPTDAPYLLVNYRYTLAESAEVFEEGGDFRYEREAIMGEVTPLVEEIGPLPQYTGPRAVSIYAPPNGLFVYLVEPGE